MKRIITALATGIFLFFVSCNSVKDKKNDAAAGNATIPAASFKVIMIQHPVADFKAWEPVYMAHDSVRQAYGITHFLIGRGFDDSNRAVVIDKITDVQKAKEFAALPDLKAAMQKAGVTGPPDFSYADVIRSDDSKIEYKDRVMIAHRVKDFDAWLKVFDSEGIEIRMENGFIDRGLARGVDDPNMVYLVFAISDMAKAKARMNSEELKRLMTDAGVEGPPRVMFYTLVD